MRKLRRIARSLLRQRDPRRRRLMMLGYLGVLVLLFLADTYFSNLSSPLKLIPQTFLAMSMGFVLLDLTSLRQFKYVAEFIDWDKVAAAADPTRGFEVVPPPADAPADAPTPRGDAGERT